MSLYHSLTRDEIICLLPKAPGNVVDVGCGTAQTLRLIKQLHPDTRTVGIELDGDVAKLAKLVADEVINCDIEKDFDLLTNYVSGADVVLLLDVIEHLRDPWGFVAKLRDILKPSSTVIASIPNVRNLKVLGPLVFEGEWNYCTAGILDRTHLRFFTKSTAMSLFVGAGFEISMVDRTGPLRRRQIKSFGGAIAYLVNTLLLGVIKDFITYQYLIKAVPRCKPDLETSP